MSTGLYPLFLKGLDKNILFELKTWPHTWKQIFHVETTRMRYIDHQTWSGYGLPAYRVPGQAIQQGNFNPSYNKHYVISNYGLMDTFPLEDIDDDLYGLIHRVIPQMGGLFAQAFNDLYETNTANFFAINGFASGSSVAGMSDGLSLFNTAHPVSVVQSGVTYSNRPSVAADLSVASVQAAITALRTQKRPNNITFMNNPPRVLVYNPSQDFVARQVTKGYWEPYSADRTENEIPRYNLKLVEWPYFQKSGATGTNNAWFMVGQQHWLYFWLRQGYQSKTDMDINTNSQKFAATCRFDQGASSPLGTYGSPGK